MVIPAMGHIDKHLAMAAIDRKYPLSIKAALAISKKLLTTTMTKLITPKYTGSQ